MRRQPRSRRVLTEQQLLLQQQHMQQLLLLLLLHMQQLKPQHSVMEIPPMAPRSLSRLNPSFCLTRAFCRHTRRSTTPNVNGQKEMATPAALTFLPTWAPAVAQSAAPVLLPDARLLPPYQSLDDPHRQAKRKTGQTRAGANTARSSKQ